MSCHYLGNRWLFHQTSIHLNSAWLLPGREPFARGQFLRSTDVRADGWRCRSRSGWLDVGWEVGISSYFPLDPGCLIGILIMVYCSSRHSNYQISFFWAWPRPVSFGEDSSESHSYPKLHGLFGISESCHDCPNSRLPSKHEVKHGLLLSSLVMFQGCLCVKMILHPILEPKTSFV